MITLATTTIAEILGWTSFTVVVGVFFCCAALVNQFRS